MDTIIDIILNYPIGLKILLSLYVVVLLIQLFYHLYFYNGIIRYNRKIKRNKVGYTTSQPPISIIVCAQNESENLRKYLPKLLEQEYPCFEVIVINDGSTDESCDVLKLLNQKYKNLYHTFLPTNAKFTSRKKICLNVGVKAAHYEHLIIVDADCEPTSSKWIANIVRNYTSETDIILGYSSYKKKNGFLYSLIGYENLLSTIQYMGFALKGKVLRGTNRNISYKKRLFSANKTFHSHLNLEYGDDDLFIQDISTSKNTKVEFTPDSITLTDREITFKNYLYDKEKRLLTQSQYKKNLKALMKVGYSSKILFDITYIAIVIGSIILKDYLLLAIIFGTFILHFIVRCLVINLTAKIVHERKFYLSILLFDMIMPWISLYVVVINFFSRNANRWR
jgi:glycosyltransferase involved in cell wall biosynthesis